MTVPSLDGATIKDRKVRGHAFVLLAVGVAIGAVGHAWIAAKSSPLPLERGPATAQCQGEPARGATHSERRAQAAAIPLAGDSSRAKGSANAIAAEDAPDDSEHELRERQSEAVVKLVFRRLQMVEHMLPKADAAELADHVQLYQQGLVDGLAYAPPELLGQLGETIEHAMCDGTTNAGALVAVTRMVRQLPELASAAGFDCVFQKRREEAVLTSALEAFGEAQLPPSPALAELRHSVTDERTRARLVALEQGVE